MRLYLNNFDVYAVTRYIFKKREREIKERENQKKVDFSKVTDKQLQQAKISKRDFELIKSLFKFDEELFLAQPIVHSKSPHILIVDIGKY
jgi:hypothetical protein